MITLRIDGCNCDLDKAPAIPLDFDIERLKDIEGEREGRSIEFELPATPANDQLFGSSRDIYATARFNSEHHTAIVERDGVKIFEGTVYLLATTIKEGRCGGYKIRVREGGAEWIESVVQGDVGDLDIAFAELLNLTTISSSWEGDKAVRFLPVYRGNQHTGYSSASTLPVERVMMTDDYHPFISIAEMVRAMFAGSGYTLRSNFLDSELGRSLYMSGDYTRSDASLAKERCDFFARRSAPATATANFTGRVYASKAFATSTIGPIVDTASPEVVDSNGVQMHETFCNNGSFSKNSVGNICFTPKYSVKAGFLLHLEYTTDYSILSRDKFVGFDTVEAAVGSKVTFSLANTCRDYRHQTKANIEYRAVVFDHVDGRKYRLLAILPDKSSSVMGEWSSRSALVSTPATAPTLLVLYYMDAEDSTWRLMTEDWALYAGYIEEEGKVDVVMDFRLPPVEVAAGASYTLDKIWFGGAKQGMSITVGTGTTLRPYFTTVPGYNSSLTFKDIAPRQLRQSELLSAIGEMFNLVFYTDRVRKEVVIEPLEFWYNKEIVDLNGRIDTLNGVVASDRGIDTPQSIELSYLDADRASQAFNTENKTVLGKWSHRNPLYGTKKSTRRVNNPLFTTTLNISDILSNAPSASLIQVGDIGIENLGIDNAFTPHIVCYKGMQELPNGECWIADDKYDRYPYATFVDGVDTNLCFEDRDGVEGLHHYYLPQLERNCEGQSITLDLHLTTAEAASLFTADGPIPSVRHRFRFNIQGESSLYRLVKVESWDMENGILRTTFERELGTI